jgi:hypothetical protein
MSTQIDTALVKGFEQGVTLLAQQEGSRLRRAVDARTVGPGEEFSFDQVGEADPVELTTRHADTPQGNISHDRRWATPKTFARAELIDKADMVRSLNDFANPYTRALGMGFGRQMDREIIAAALATARTGKTSSTSTESFDTTNCRIAHGGVGLNLAKLNEAAYILRKYEMPKPWFLVVTLQQRQAAQPGRDRHLRWIHLDPDGAGVDLQHHAELPRVDEARDAPGNRRGADRADHGREHEELQYAGVLPGRLRCDPDAAARCRRGAMHRVEVNG